MEKKKAFDSSTQWISDEQKIHETADYGRNKTAVEEALTEQQRRVKLVNDYSADVTKAKSASKSSSESKQVESAYGELKEVASHRLGCLQDIAQIASLEDVFNMMSIEFAQRATNLVVDACSEATQPESQNEESEAGSDGIARAAQSCILAVRNNWNWISKLVKCADIHLKHVSEYHQFFHEGKEYDKWMPSELNKHINTLENIKPEEDDGQKLLILLKETLAVFLHWENKINTLFEKSRKIVPVHFRTKPLDHYRPVMSLCDYKTNEINIQEGEELTLIDNSKPQIWLVRNMHATESHVPSVICVIPGPDTDAVSMATRLRILLLKTWTVSLKNLGRVVIMYFTLILRQQDDATAKKLRCLIDDDKMRTIQTLQWIVDIFSKYWSQDPQYQTLYTHIGSTRDTLKEKGQPNDYDSSFNRDYIYKIKSMEEILTFFRNFLRQWETYKLLSESSRYTDQMLLVENWETLKYFPTEDVLRKVSLGFEEGSSGSGSSGMMITKMETSTLNSGLEDGSSGSGSSEVVVTKTETSTLNSEMEQGTSGSGSSEVLITKTETTTLHAVQDETDMNNEEEMTESMGMEETIETMTTVTETEVSNGGQVTTTEITEEYETEYTSAETEQLMHAEQEERKKFVITDLDIDTSDTGTVDISKLSPRQPGDGTDSTSDMYGNGKPTAEKNSEAFLDQTLVQRMSTADKRSKQISKLSTIFQKTMSSSTHTKTVVADHDVRPKLKSPTSPGLAKSRIPISRRGKTSMSRIQRAVSLDQLPSNKYDYDNTSSMTVSSTDLSLQSDCQFDSGVGISMQSVSESNLRNHQDKLSSSSDVLIYTQETVSHLPIAVKTIDAIRPKVKMCSVGTQYECETPEEQLDAGITVINITDQSLKSSQNQTISANQLTAEYKVSSTTNLNESLIALKHAKDDDDTLHSQKGTLEINIADELNIAANEQSKSLLLNTELTETNISSHNQDLSLKTNNKNEMMSTDIIVENEEVDGLPPKSSSLFITKDSGIPVSTKARKKSKKEKRKEKKASMEMKGPKDSEGVVNIYSTTTVTSTTTTNISSTAATPTTIMSSTVKTTTMNISGAVALSTEESEEEEYHSANEFGLTADGGVRRRTTATAAAAGIQLVRETHNHDTEQLVLLQEAITALSAPPETSSDNKALCLKICKACLPLQMLMLMLLGLACLFPMSEEEYNCALANNFESSLDVMLKHKDGPPPF